MEHRYSILRKHLDELGYEQCLIIEAVPLVERLLADLVKTTESLFHFKNVAQSAIEERDQLQLGAEPYKCDNAKLVKECNDLHLAFLQYREQTDKSTRELKLKIHNLEKDNDDLSRHLDDLQKSGNKSSSTNLRRRTMATRQSAPFVSVDTAKNLKSDKSKEIHKCTCNAEHVQQLQHEIKNLKSDIIKQNSHCECLKDKLNNRDKEIQRLSNMLEGGRSINALNKDCCYKDMCAKLRKLNEYNSTVACEKKKLEMQLADAISKQHEAMKRALQLADRNKELERELRDIDQMALAVEEECNSAVKKNHSKASKAQEQLESCHSKLHILKREVLELRSSKSEIEAELEIFKEEKENLNRILENTLDDKKKMTDRINQFTRIEHDLNLEIDRLMQTCTLQKRKIADLEYQLTGKSDNKSNENMNTDKYRKIADSKYARPKNIGRQNSIRQQQDDHNDILEKLKGEKDYFQQECQRLCQELNNLPENSEISCDVKRRLAEREDTVKRLEREVQELTREKHTLISRLENNREAGAISPSLKSTLSRVEKERDLARGDVKRLEEERDSLRRKLKSSTDTYNSDRDRLQKLMNTSEEKLRTLETERRELMSVQGNRRATINSLEGQMESISTQLKTTQQELERTNTLYGQVKTLQEQTDRALADTQGQLSQIEMDYARAQERVRILEKDRSELEKELSMLKNDVSVLRGNLGKVDGQRDNLLIELDTKTERIALLEQELKSKDSKLVLLETSGTELKQKLSVYTDDVASKEYQLKNTCTEIECVKHQLEEALKAKNHAVNENRRLQNDLTKVSIDWKNTNGDLERATREIEDLKSQLQQYVHEVKRVEDLMCKKECERAEMLDHFRSLSQEATLLETSNHTLETKTQEVKSKLCDAQCRIQDMESQVEELKTLNKDYELQIAQLTCQIACMETRLKQHSGSNNKSEKELAAMKELCCKLDGQKDLLMKEIKEKDESRCLLEREKERMRVDINKLRDSLDSEQSNIGSLEHLLAESRRETVEQRLINEELQAEIQRLKSMVEDLQAKLFNHSVQTFNTVDVRLNSDVSPRSISSIVTNIMQKSQQEIPAPTSPRSYEMNSGYTKKPLKKSHEPLQEKEENDTYRSHTTVDIECPKCNSPIKTRVQVGNEKGSNVCICSSADLSKATYCYGYKEGEFVSNTDINTHLNTGRNENCKTARPTILRISKCTPPTKSCCCTRFTPDTK